MDKNGILWSATIGSGSGVRGAAPVIRIDAIPNAQGQLVVPQHVTHALSTDGQLARH